MSEQDDTDGESSKGARRQRLRREYQEGKFLQLWGALVAQGMLAPAPPGGPFSGLLPQEEELHGHDRGVFLFAGINERVGVTQQELLQALAGQACDRVHLRDFHQAWYLRGLVGLSDDVASTHRHLLAVRQRAGWRHTSTLGTSSGAFAAILYGVLMKAQRILAFSPQARIGDLLDPGMLGGRRPEQLARFTDLPALIQAQGYSGRIDLFFGRRNARDRAAAEALAACPCVTLHPLETADHGSFTFLYRQGRLAEALGRL